MEFFYAGRKRSFYFILCFVAIFCNQALDNSSTLYQCGKDNFKPISASLNDIVPLNKDNMKSKRGLDSDGFKDFNIFLDLNNFDDEIKKYKLTDKRDIFVKGMEKAIKTLQSLLKVKRTRNYVFKDESLRDILIYNWDKNKIGSGVKKGMVDLGIDLYIFVRFGDNYELGNDVLASAGPRYLDTVTGQPLLGVININRETDYTKNNSLRYFEGIIIHELTHVLGFMRFFFEKYFHNYFTKKDKYGIKRAYINSTRVVDVAKKYFNCNEVDGVELENIEGDLSSGSHWGARILNGEYMTSFISSQDTAISEFTLALLEDSGYYKANYYTGGLMQFGKNKGCEFLFSKCVNNNNINQKFSNEFFDEVKDEIFNLDSSCSSGRQSRGYHGFIYYEDDIPNEYQYFSKKYGGLDVADYCPVTVDYYEEQKNIYYIGHCSEIGGKNYGSVIPYKDLKNNVVTYESGFLSSITGEFHSDNSFCVLSSLISKKIDNYKLYSNTLRAVCYKMHCSDRSLTIQINNTFLVCPREGGKIANPNFDGYLLCPDYNLICSGTVLCNDMFDCVEKKSLLKNVEYDYITKTSQDYDSIIDEKISENAYELSNNGKCPKFCSQCNEKGECLIAVKCIAGQYY